MNTTELQSEVAAQIREWHGKAEECAEEAKDFVQNALEAAVTCGQYLEKASQMNKGRMLAWLRDNVPDLSPTRAKAYLSMFHTREHRANALADHRQLLMLGIVDQQEREPNAKPAAPNTKWVSQVGSIRGWFDKMDRERPIDEWPQEERETVADQLKPIVELYKRLGGEGL